MVPGIVTSTPPSFKLGFNGNFLNDFEGLITFDLCEYKVNENDFTATLVWSKEFTNLQANVAGNCLQINEEKFIAAFGSQGYIEEFMKDGSKVLSLDPGGLIYQVMKTVDY